MRKPMVTRTITTTKATVMCLDIESNTPVTQDFILPRTYSDPAKIIKAISVLTEGTPIKPVHVVNSEINNVLYGMTESKFMELADVLPPRETGEESAETDE